MQDEGCNGWKNYETWAVGVYLDGNYDGPGTYYETIERVRNTSQEAQSVDQVTEGVWTIEQATRYMVADTLKDWVEENVQPHSYDDDHPDPQLHPLVSDLLSTSLSAVDWNELAEAWIENVSEQVSA